MEKRVFISGPSGSGKTTLAQYISARYRIPFIEGSTKPLWEKHGIKSHPHLINRTISTPKWGLEFQNEVLDYRNQRLSGLTSFVTDRSPVDNLVYFLLQCSHLVDDDYIEDYKSMCNNSFGNGYNHIITLENGLELEDDGFRVNNLHYQRLTQSVFDMVIRDNYLWLDDENRFNVRHIEIWDWEARVEIVDKILNPKEDNLCKRVIRKFWP